VTHDLGSLPVACDRVVLMKEGLIWNEGSPEALLTDENLSRLYDIPVSVIKRRREEAVLV
jgi:iron complex transport system ATP-binding protein